MPRPPGSQHGSQQQEADGRMEPREEQHFGPGNPAGAVPARRWRLDADDAPASSPRRDAPPRLSCLLGRSPRSPPAASLLQKHRNPGSESGAWST
jgi:hypothetical protein